MEHIILCLPQGGLCNRLRTIAGVLALSNRLATKNLYFLWLNNDELNVPFERLLANFPYPVYNIKSKLGKKLIPSLLLRLLPQNRIFNKPLFDGELKDADLDKVRNKSFFVYSAFKLIPTTDFSFIHVAPNLEMLTSCQIDGNTIGVHIRRTDHKKSIQMSPTSLFIEEMEKRIKENENVKFYLATDDKNEENALLSRFGSRIILYKKRSLDRNSNIGMEDAMVDLVNLSRCREVIGSCSSSFSRTAAEWGGIPYSLLQLK